MVGRTSKQTRNRTTAKELARRLQGLIDVSRFSFLKRLNMRCERKVEEKMG
jgi:hypothetical protein